MPRLLFSDKLWTKLKKILIEERIYNKSNLHMMVEGMLYRMRVSCSNGMRPLMVTYVTCQQTLISGTNKD